MVAGKAIAALYEQAVIVDDPQWTEVKAQLALGQVVFR
jgi:hypothetical protein